MIAALIIVLTTAAVAAALGFGAALAAGRFWRLGYPPYWFAVGGGIAGAILSILVIAVPPSWFSDGGQVAVDEVLPYMGTIKQNEPALYERIETSVIRDQYDGLGADRVRANARTLVASYVADKSVFLPDDMIYELSAATRDALAHLAAHERWDACARLALGGQVGDIDAQLSPELVERNANNTVRVILAKRREDPPKMPAEEFAQLASNAFGEASHATGILPEEIDRILAGGGDAPKTCRLMKSFFDALLAHPVSVAAAALRTLASGERRTGAS